MTGGGRRGPLRTHPPGRRRGNGAGVRGVRPEPETPDRGEDHPREPRLRPRMDQTLSPRSGTDGHRQPSRYTGDLRRRNQRGGIPAPVPRHGVRGRRHRRKPAGAAGVAAHRRGGVPRRAGRRRPRRDTPAPHLPPRPQTVESDALRQRDRESTRLRAGRRHRLRSVPLHHHGTDHRNTRVHGARTDRIPGRDTADGPLRAGTDHARDAHRRPGGHRGQRVHGVVAAGLRGGTGYPGRTARDPGRYGGTDHVHAGEETGKPPGRGEYRPLGTDASRDRFRGPGERRGQSRPICTRSR